VTHAAASWADFAPVFRHAGRTGRDPLALLGPRPRTVCLGKLALFLSPVAVTRDALPDAPWAAVSRVPPARPLRPARPADPRELPGRFQEAVERQCGDAGTVAVSLSGGMDSLAVLAGLARSRAARDRKLIAVVSADRADNGLSPAVVARQQVEALQVDCPVHEIGTDLPSFGEPDWSPSGPRFYSTPREHRGIAQTALEAGADVLLTGYGADQLLRSPAGQLPRLLSQGRLGAAARYARDAADGERGLLADLLAVSDLGSPRRAALFLSLCVLPGYQRCAGPDLLADQYRPAVGRWFAEFLGAQADHHRRQGWSAARALLFEAVYPHDLSPAATELRERSPFCDPGFARWAWALPASCRYGPAPRSGYLRDKHLICGLIPPRLWPLLPRRSMRGVRSLRAYWSRWERRPDLLIEHGLLREDWRSRVRHLFDLQMVDACEHWLRCALDRGAAVTA
jgi:hypothetical protein